MTTELIQVVKELDRLDILFNKILTRDKFEMKEDHKLNYLNKCHNWKNEIKNIKKQVVDNKELFVENN